MPKKKRSAIIKLCIVWGSFFAFVQIGIIVFFKKSNPTRTTAESLEQGVESISDQRKRDSIKLQAAVRAFYTKEKRYPGSLQELVPKYIPEVPKDPDTHKPYEYQVNGSLVLIGSQTTKGNAGKSPKESNPETQTALLETLAEEEKLQVQWVYDPAGKRDPFLPFDVRPQIDEDESKPLIERLTLGQLKLTAVLDNQGDPTAMVETITGRGFTVKKGTKIGNQNGVVVEIHPDKLIVLETTTDFTGEQKTQTTELPLRTKNQEPELSGRITKKTQKRH